MIPTPVLAVTGPDHDLVDGSTRTRHTDGSTRASYAERAHLTAALIDEAHDPATPPAHRARLLDEVVVANHRVACAVARRYRGRGISDDDLQQAACEGLVKAVHRFDPHLEHDFLSYAVPSIRGEVQRYFRDHGWTVRPPRQLQQLQWALNRAADRLASELGREPSRAELRERLGIDETTLREVEVSFRCFHPPSIDRPLASGAGVGLVEVLAAPSQIEEVEARVTLGPPLRRLRPRDREIVYLRYYEGLTQQEIGALLGVTQAQVSRLLTRILRGLRDELGDAAEPDHAAELASIA